MLGKIKRIINGEIPTSYLVRKGLKVGKNFSRMFYRPVTLFFNLNR